MDRKQMLVLEKFGIDPQEVIHRDGRYWMTFSQLGVALGYKFPKQSMSKLVDRHRKELQPFIGVVNLTTPGGVQETTIIDTDGQYTIALLANTQKGRKFRRIVVGMLKALERKEFVHISAFQKWQGDVLAQVAEWKTDLIELKVSKYLETAPRMDRDKYRRMLRYREMGLSQKDTAKLLDVSKDVIQYAEKIVRQFDVAAGPLAMIPTCTAEAIQ